LAELTLIEILKKLCRRIKQLPLILLPPGRQSWELIPVCMQGWAVEPQAQPGSGAREAFLLPWGMERVISVTTVSTSMF
jgi:hypothetical protein